MDSSSAGEELDASLSSTNNNNSEISTSSSLTVNKVNDNDTDNTNTENENRSVYFDATTTTISSDELSTDGENIMATEEQIDGDNCICMTREQYDLIISQSTQLESQLKEATSHHAKHLAEDHHHHHHIMNKHSQDEHTKNWGALRKGTLEFIDELEHISVLLGVIKKPHLRQYWRGSVLVRERNERKTSYAELFYDLVFVAAVRQLGHHVSQHLSGTEFGMFVVLFASIWKIWMETTIYLNQFSTEDLFHKLYFLLMMIGMLGMTINSTEAGEESKQAFVIFYLFCRGLQAIMYLWVFVCIKEVRPMQLFRISLIVTGASFWIASIFSEFPNPPILWAASIVFEFVAGFFQTPITRSRLPINIEHLAERCGLFITIVLGEVVVGVVFTPSSIPHDTSTTHVYVQAFMGLAIAANLHWVYFDVEASPRGILHHAMRRDKRTGFIWVNIHQPFAASIIILSAGLVRVIEHAAEGEHEHDEGTKWLLCLSVSVALFSISIIGATHKSRLEKSVRIPKIIRVLVRISMAVIMIFLPLAKHLTVYHVLGILTAFTSLIVLIELYGSYQTQAAMNKSSKPKRVKKSIKELRALSSMDLHAKK